MWPAVPTMTDFIGDSIVGLWSYSIQRSRDESRKRASLVAFEMRQ
jgi:hypothetical protein